MPAPTIEERAEQREEATEQFRQVVAAEADVTRDEEALLHGVFSLGDTAVRRHQLRLGTGVPGIGPHGAGHAATSPSDSMLRRRREQAGRTSGRHDRWQSDSRFDRRYDEAGYATRPSERDRIDHDRSIWSPWG